MREKEYLKLRYAAMISSAGIILLLSGAVTMTPLLILFSHPEEIVYAWDFAIPAASLLLIGFILWKGFHPPRNITLTVQEGGIVVLLGWIVVIIFSALPFTAVPELSYSRALFESVSGWTTTGLSVIDVAGAGKIILIWRSIIQFAGGAGLAIIMMSAILGPTGRGISSAEGRSDQLVPQVRQSARLVLIIYFCYALSGTFAYRAAGMSFFDAVNHSFAAVSTGGFSTQADSIGFWDSIAIEAVTLPLMLLGNLSFVTAWLIWRGRLRMATKNGELRLLTVIIPVAASVMFLFTSRMLYPQLEKSVRVTVFETITAVTTTGFSTVSYSNWNASGLFLLVILMLIGGGTCSTAGGIKQFRIYLLWKVLNWEIRRYLLPRTAIMEQSVWEGSRRIFVDDARIRQAAAFISLYLVTYVLGVMVLCASGFDLADSIFEFASAIGTVGLSVGVTGSGMPDTALWSEIIAMFLGRLEFTVVIVSLIKIAGDSQKMLSKNQKEKVQDE